MTEIDLLTYTILKNRDEKKLKNLIEDLLTLSELKMLANRIRIIEQLKMDRPQHEIAKQLGVGVATVSRLAQNLKIK